MVFYSVQELHINFNGLNDADESITNGIVYKSLGAMQTNVVVVSSWCWDKLKGVSNWVSAIFTDSYEPLNSDHFAFVSKTKDPNHL